MTQNFTKSRLAVALTLASVCQGAFAMERAAEDDIPQWIRDESLAYSLQGPSVPKGIHNHEPIPQWVQDESLAYSVQIPSEPKATKTLDDIPQWVRDESLAYSLQEPKFQKSQYRPDEEQGQLETAIMISLGEAQGIIHFDPEMDLQERRLSELLMTVPTEVEAGEHDYAISLILSFMGIKNLHPLFQDQAQDMMATVKAAKATPKSAPKRVELQSVMVPVVLTPVTPSLGAKLPDLLPLEEPELLRLTNLERTKHGLAPFTMNANLMAAARGHSQKMAFYQLMDHIIENKNIGHRATAAGYNYRSVGENIAWSIGHSMDHIVQGWMNSPGHRANLLNPAFTELGVGVAITADGKRFWTQNFGTQR